MLRNLIRIQDPDVPIYRIFKREHFLEGLQEHSLVLVSPDQWDDPLENILLHCGITYMQDGKYKQEFFDNIRKPTYAQCWSLAAESDALWRIYSTVVPDPNTHKNTKAEKEGVKVRTTARKLLNSLWNAKSSAQENSCFLGQIKYMPKEQSIQMIANEIGRMRLNAFDSGRGHADILLIKHEPFQYEQEVRLIYVEHNEGWRNDHHYRIHIDPDSLFDEVILDPRLSSDDARDREAELRSFGFTGSVTKSDLYQKVLYEILIDERKSTNS